MVGWLLAKRNKKGINLEELLAGLLTVGLKVMMMVHSCLKWPLEEIYNLIFEHLTYSAILVPNWTT